MHELGGFHRQLRKVGTKGLGQYLQRLVQVHAGIDQIAGGLHGFRATNAFDNGRRGVCVGQRVLARCQLFPNQQRLGKRTGAAQRVYLVRNGSGRCSQQMRQLTTDGRGLKCRWYGSVFSSCWGQ